MQETIARLIDANRRLTKTNQLYDAFFDYSPDLLAIAEDGHFVKLSKAWEDMTGWSREELMSKPFVYFVIDDDVNLTVKEDNLISEGKATDDFTNTYRCKDGSTVKLQWRSRNLDGITFAVARVV
jgi:PAS domain S-box-containing protein